MDSSLSWHWSLWKDHPFDLQPGDYLHLSCNWTNLTQMFWKKREREHKAGEIWEEVEVREKDNHGHREGAGKSIKRKKTSCDCVITDTLNSRMKQNNEHKFEGS